MNIDDIQNYFQNYKVKVEDGNLYAYYSNDKYLVLENVEKSNVLSMYKRLMFSVLDLFKWVSDDKDISFKIKEIINNYFKVDIDFSINLIDDYIEIRYLNKRLIIGNNIIEDMKHEPVLISLAYAANNKKYKDLIGRLTQAIYNDSRAEINNKYFEIIKNSKAWNELMILHSKLNAEYCEIVQHTKDDGFVFVNRNKWCSILDKMPDIKEYVFDFETGDILLNNTRIFKLALYKNLVKMYKNEWFEKPFETCLLLNRAHYDFYLALDGCNKNNISIILLEDGSFKISNYYKQITPTGFQDAYDFVKKTAYNIKNRKESQMLSIISANNISIWKLCMDEYEKIDFDGYKNICKRREIDDEKAIAMYYSIFSIIQKVKDNKIIKNWAILGNGYEVEFTKDAIEVMEGDCSEIFINTSNIPFDVAFSSFPIEYISNMLKNREFVFSNTINIIKILETDRAKDISDDISESIKYMDKKYLPLLKLKLKQNEKNIEKSIVNAINNLESNN